MIKILSGQESLEIKKRLARKMKAEDLITDWADLSGRNPLWDLVELKDIYDELFITNNEGKVMLLELFSKFLSTQYNSILMFPADGYLATFDFDDVNPSTLRCRPIIEIDATDLKKIKKLSKFVIPEDVYFFDYQLSWLLFLCHEKFQLLGGTHEFVTRFREYWIDSKNYIDEKWSEIFVSRKCRP